MSWWALISTVSASALAVVAIGYAIYTAYTTENAHHSNVPKSKKDEIVTYDDVKSNVRSKSVHKFRDQKTQTVTNPQGEVSSATSDGEDSVCSFDSMEVRRRNIRSKSVTKSDGNGNAKTSPVNATLQMSLSSKFPDPGTQMCNNCLNQSDLMKFWEQGDASSVISDGQDSICSFDSTEPGAEPITSIDECNIPTWKEMSDLSKSLLVCSACDERLVSTITIPCEHPYMCEDCAAVVFKYYHECPVCQFKIKGYECVNS